MNAGKIDDQKRLTRLLSRAADGLDLPPEFASKGPARIVGFTASAAAGKSTLINQIVGILREDGKTAVVLAIDPSVPENGGAFLGDRIRMREHYLDDGVFIRSLSSRGAKDSSAPNIGSVIKVASHFADFVLVESPGAGQVDLGIKNSVDTFIFLPDTKADIINLMKASVHEYADILAVNFRNGSDDEKRFSAMLKGLCRDLQNGWTQLVFEINALTGKGVVELVREGIYKHRDFIPLSI